MQVLMLAPDVASDRLSVLPRVAAKCWEDQHFRDRWRTLLSVDELVGDVITALTDANVLSDTYIFYSSGELRCLQDSAPLLLTGTNGLNLLTCLCVSALWLQITGSRNFHEPLELLPFLPELVCCVTHVERQVQARSMACRYVEGAPI